MSTQLYAVSPLVLIRDVSGYDQYFYQGQPVAGEFDKDRVAALLAEGHLVEVEMVVVEPVALSDEAPAKSANKPDWVAYAVLQGMDPDEAEKATKDDLVSRYAPTEA